MSVALTCIFIMRHNVYVVLEVLDGKADRLLPRRPLLPSLRSRLAWRQAAGSISTTAARTAEVGKTARRTASAFVRDQRARENTLVRGTAAMRSGRFGCHYCPHHIIFRLLNQSDVVLMCENIFSANVSSQFGTVYRRALLVLSHYCRLEILWVMSTSVYIPNTDRCFSILFLLSMYLVFSLLASLVQYTEAVVL